MLYAILILIGAAMAGYYFWDQHRLKKELEELQRQELAEQEARAAAAADRPWKKLPRAPLFVAACDSALHQTGTLWPGGWSPTEIVCAENKLEIKWERHNDGLIEHLLAFHPEAEVTPEGNHAKRTISIESLPNENEDPPPARERLIQLTDIARSHGWPFSLNNKQSAVLGQVQPAGNWKPIYWAITDTQTTPASMIVALDANGLRISEIRLVFAGGIMKWTMEGTQYVHP